MSGQKRKINNISNDFSRYPGNFKNAKYTNTPVLFPQIVKVEPMNMKQNYQIENKLYTLVTKLENKICKLETLLKFQNKKIDKLENEISNIKSCQIENNEIRDLVNEVQNKLNLPDDLHQELQQETEFSYIS